MLCNVPMDVWALKCFLTPNLINIPQGVHNVLVPGMMLLSVKSLNLCSYDHTSIFMFIPCVYWTHWWIISILLNICFFFLYSWTSCISKRHNWIQFCSESTGIWPNISFLQLMYSKARNWGEDTAKKANQLRCSEKNMLIEGESSVTNSSIYL